jgi:hypothetical protein
MNAAQMAKINMKIKHLQEREKDIGKNSSH